MRHWTIVLVLLAGIATTIGLGGIASGSAAAIHALFVGAFLVACAMAALARPRPT